MLKAVGFDFDHTLGVDNKLERVAFVQVTAAIAQRTGRSVDEAAAHAAIDRELTLFRAGRCSLQHALQTAFETLLGQKAPSDAEAQFRECALSLVPRFVRALPGAADLLQRLDAQAIPYAILTNGWNPLQQKKADRIGFTRPVLVSEDLGVRKPEPAAFFALARVLAAEPATIAYVGDDPAVDIAGALAAGMHGIWFHWEARAYPAGIPPPSATVERIVDVLQFFC